MPLSPSLLNLAVSFGISPERIETFATTNDLRVRARHYGVSEPCVLSYGDKTHGLRIQVDELIGGENYRILLRQPLPDDAFADTYFRLSELNPSIRFLATEDTEFLTRFILLHEIAHVVLKHALITNDRDEAEADEWAFSRMPHAKAAPDGF